VEKIGSKKLQIWLPFLLSLAVAFGMFIGYKLREKTTGAAIFTKNVQKTNVQEVLDLIKNRYVDQKIVDSINTLVVEGLLNNLDPHSVFIPAADLPSVNEVLQGNFDGIGIEFQIFNDTVNVLSVNKNGPSAKAGLQVGDKFIFVNDTILVANKKITGEGIRKLLKGERGSKVSVTVLRNNKLVKATITRGLIPVPSVDVAYLITPTVGFIRINKFAESTYEEFMPKLDSLKRAGMEELILDVRGNSGGFLGEAVDIADEFLDGNKLVVYTKGDKTDRIEYNCKRNGLFETGNLAVLIDESSASASEVLAGALQDWDRATIIGRRSFGKGLVQQQFQLTDGSGLRLTVAKYFTPLGRNIQKPYDKGRDAYKDDLIERLHNGELVVGDTTKPKGKAFKTPKGNTVYGGGGITPNVFIPFDTTLQTKAIFSLFLKGTISKFIYRHYVSNKSYFDNYTTPASFAIGFTPTPNLWGNLTNVAKADSINLQQLSASEKKSLEQKMGSYFARQIWGAQGYYEVANKQDIMVLKALAALQNK